MISSCQTYHNVVGEYTFSTNGVGATVVGELVNRDFQFNPIIAGLGIVITQPILPGPIIISAGAASTSSLQTSYDNGQTIELLSGNIDISGSNSVNFNNISGIQINNGIRQYMYNELGGLYVDTDEILNWPNAAFNGTYSAINSIVHFEITFIGYETTSGDSFTAKLLGRYDNSILGLDVTKTISNTIVDVNAAISGGLSFTLEVFSGTEYSISWSIDFKILDRSV